MTMIKRSYKIVLVLIMIVMMTASCGIFKGSHGKRGCGCPSKKGMVGF